MHDDTSIQRLAPRAPGQRRAAAVATAIAVAVGLTLGAVVGAPVRASAATTESEAADYASDAFGDAWDFTSAADFNTDFSGTPRDGVRRCTQGGTDAGGTSCSWCTRSRAAWRPVGTALVSRSTRHGTRG
ncbi:hypothetical protein [Curtobacterium sp. MCPF17_052]|uniref:hypothetical protein n=1 Tax=Curtobacterium sp. MCPF17_052 TaxID=2175655 RepID=UPI0024DFF7F7|nr:hypothetical protein [Curtobacterium sp. MCPF17_052]WIB12382.1 hypothetical protein DEJ36_17115 [Curtobacterium sp. MCPF17_052]